MLGDVDVLRFTRIPEPVPEGFARTWLERYDAGRRAGDREAFAAVDDDGTFLGLALAPEIDRDAREAELGYVVAPAARGRGVGTEMLRRLTEWAFDELGLARATLIIDVTNAASRKVAERSGYELEGVMRSTFLKEGRPRVDAELWARIA